MFKLNFDLFYELNHGSVVSVTHSNDRLGIDSTSFYRVRNSTLEVKYVDHTNDKIYERLADVMAKEGMPAPADWALLKNREIDRIKVDEHVSTWTLSHDRLEVLTICELAQVPCGPIYAIDEIFEDPQYAARGNILKVHDDRVGELSIPNLVPRLSDTPGSVNWLGPRLGQHNDEIFKTELGMTVEEIERLKAKGVV